MPEQVDGCGAHRMARAVALLFGAALLLAGERAAARWLQGSEGRAGVCDDLGRPALCLPPP